MLFAADCVGDAAREAVERMADGDVLLLENLRFHPGEEADDADFAADLARSGDIYVNDAFSAAHRAHASTSAITRLLPSYAGEAMKRELHALDVALGASASTRCSASSAARRSRPSSTCCAIWSVKLDALAIGGGMANTFLFADGHEVGASYCEKDLAGVAREIVALAAENNCELLLPIDTIVAERAAPGEAARVRELGEVDDNERILDAGPRTVERLKAAMERGEDPGLERPARGVRDAAVRRRHRRRRPPCGRCCARRASWSASPAAATPSPP